MKTEIGKSKREHETQQEMSTCNKEKNSKKYERGEGRAAEIVERKK